MKKLLAVSMALLATAFAAELAFAGAYDELSAKEQNSIQSGSMVVHTEDGDGSAWPKITAYQRVEATPEEVTAVFADYELHSKLFSRITKSKISKCNGRCTDVDYTMSLKGIPGNPLPDENYTTRDCVSTYGNGAYRVEWTKVRADNIQHIEGTLRVEQLGTGSLVSYYNFIIPHKPELAKFIASMAIKQVRDTTNALAKQVTNERKSNQEQLARQLEELRKQL